ncbi:MAG: hypothetical protein V2B19_23595 [Pseudomonadota bacterium]
MRAGSTVSANSNKNLSVIVIEFFTGMAYKVSQSAEKRSLRGIVYFIAWLLSMALATQAIASETYTYTGNAFTEFGGTLTPPQDRITGSFTVDTPLSAGGYHLIGTGAKFSFTSGGYTFNDDSIAAYSFFYPYGNPVFFIRIDSSGQVSGWQISLANLSNTAIVCSWYLPDYISTWDSLRKISGSSQEWCASNYSLPGQWTKSDSTSVPVPAFGVWGMVFTVAVLVALNSCKMRKKW